MKRTARKAATREAQHLPGGRRALLRAASLAAACGALGACASNFESVDGTVREAALAEAPFLGTWISELDGARLVVESEGIFSVEVPATADKPARGAVGRWTYDGTTAVFTNLAGSGSCAEIPGAYRPEVVRDTVRFEMVRDGCPGREEHMAWPWTRRRAKPGA